MSTKTTPTTAERIRINLFEYGVLKHPAQISTDDYHKEVRFIIDTELERERQQVRDLLFRSLNTFRSMQKAGLLAAGERKLADETEAALVMLEPSRENENRAS